MPNLLVEIGTEELPVDSLAVIYTHLQPAAKQAFETHRLVFKQINSEATPRRIALFVEALADRQEDRDLEIPGPSCEKAFDQDRPTPVLEGFLKSKKAQIQEVKIKDTPKGRYVFIEKKEKGKSVREIIPALVNSIFSSLPFPKQMRWEPSGFRFPRPVRWMAALLDRTSISLRMAEVTSSRQSYGHRFLAPKAIALANADWKKYKASLKRAHVILSLEERESMIRKGLERFHQKAFDEDLVHTTAQLVEEPFLIQASFSAAYLDLPAEVLACCMKKNQKIFACYDTRLHLVNRFIAVLNGKRRGLAKIKSDYENVLESRLKDARYFYECDTKEPLEAKLPLLHQIVYLGKLGTLHEKTARLERLAEILTSLVGRDDLKAELRRAARLSKIDLMTHLVYEFPELQGIAGREYALEAGEKESIANAIGTQYLPKNLAEDYGSLSRSLTPLGALLGLIDRLDHLVGTFGTGLEPTGSQDPFAIRRAGGVFVKIVRAFGFHFSLEELTGECIRLYGNALTQPPGQVMERLRLFLRERTAFELAVRSGSRDWEILEAVFKTSFDDMADVYKRYDVLHHLYHEDPKIFLKTAKVVERTANILKGVKDRTGDIDPNLFREPLEKELYRLLEEKSGEIHQALERREYEKGTVLMGRYFHEPLHLFFEKVLVNADDPDVRRNRQALMKRIHSLYADRLADLSTLSRIELE